MDFDNIRGVIELGNINLKCVIFEISDNKCTRFKAIKNSEKSINLLCYKLSSQLVDEAIRHNRLPAKAVQSLSEADVILTIRNGLSQNPSLRKEAKSLNIPIHVIKSNSLHQIERGIERLVAKNLGALSHAKLSLLHSTNLEDEITSGSMLLNNGSVCNETVKQFLDKG